MDLSLEFASSPRIAKQIPVTGREIFLTFDDGPHPEQTTAVLEVLQKHQALATFFVIGEKCLAAPDVVRNIVKDGHAIGNHSIDHGYGPLFSNVVKLQNWIAESEAVIADVAGVKTVGFRPPAGVVTPPMIKACENLNLDIILWSHRFYDSIWGWSKLSAQRSLAAIRPGQIILLHDVRADRGQAGFLVTLDYYLTEIRARGFSFLKVPGSAVGP